MVSSSCAVAILQQMVKDGFMDLLAKIPFQDFVRARHHDSNRSTQGMHASKMLTQSTEIIKLHCSVISRCLCSSDLKQFTATISVGLSGNLELLTSVY